MNFVMENDTIEWLNSGERTTSISGFYKSEYSKREEENIIRVPKESTGGWLLFSQVCRKFGVVLSGSHGWVPNPSSGPAMTFWGPEASL